MKKFLMLLSILCCGIAAAHTINWRVDGNIYQTTTCDSGESITPPTAPYKYGYHFVKWAKYIPIEYLESTGTQYIDTGISNPFRIVADIEFTDVQSSQFFAGRFANQTRNYVTSISGVWALGMGWNRLSSSTISVNARYSIDASTIPNNGYIIVDGNNVLTVSETYTVPSGNVTLFSVPNAGGANVKIHFCKLYDNDILVRDFIPVLDKDGVPCMYDRVEKKYYYNAGTGQFIAGPVLQ